MSYSVTYTEEAARVRDALVEGERARLLDGLSVLSSAPFAGDSSAVNGDVTARRVKLADGSDVTYAVIVRRRLVVVIDIAPVTA